MNNNGNFTGKLIQRNLIILPKVQLIREYQVDEDDIDIPDFPKYVIKHHKSKFEFDGRTDIDCLTKVYPSICDGAIISVCSKWGIYVENGKQNLGRVYIEMKDQEGKTYRRATRSFLQANISEECVIVSTNSEHTLQLISAFLTRSEKSENNLK